LSSRYVLSPAARVDFERIWDHTHDHWGIHQAEQYLRELEHAIGRVAANPRIGRECDEIRPGYRKLAAGSHMLFYRVIADDAGDVIDVARVLHQRVDVDRHPL